MARVWLIVGMLAGFPFLCADEAQAQWQPDKLYGNTQRACARARSGMDKDECQYLAEMLISNLRDCIHDGSPYASRCSRMLPNAQNMLNRVNGDPVLRNHRAEQREAARGPTGIVPYRSPGRDCYQMSGYYTMWNCR